MSAVHKAHSNLQRAFSFFALLNTGLGYDVILQSEFYTHIAVKTGHSHSNHAAIDSLG